MSRPDDAAQDVVATYLTAYVTAVEAGEEPPSLDELDDDTRAQVVEVVELLGAPDTSAPTGVPGPSEVADAEDRPGAESEFAVAHGFIRPAPDVVVVGPAVRRARTSAGLTLAGVVEAMSVRGSTVDTTTLDDVERAPTCRMPPRDARLLAAVLDLPLAAIEATAEPWPADEAGLDTVRQLGVDAVSLGGAAVVRTARGDHLGLLRCSGDATMLDSRTYREAAAERLTGPWSHLAGVLLVTEQPPHRALAVDALDCVTRAHAPSGLSGFSRLGRPEPLAEALATYDETYAVHWTDPAPLEPLAPGDGTTEPAGDVTGRIAALAERLGEEGRRARQVGKRPGYEAASRWLGGLTPHRLAEVLDGLAGQSDDEPDEASEWLQEVISR